MHGVAISLLCQASPPDMQTLLCQKYDKRVRKDPRHNVTAKFMGRLFFFWERAPIYMFSVQSRGVFTGREAPKGLMAIASSFFRAAAKAGPMFTSSEYLHSTQSLMARFC